jgi:hypothetical protein
MLPKWHVLIGLLVTILLKLTTSIEPLLLLAFFLATFLIDIDHYFFFVLRKKNFDPFSSYNWFIEKEKEYLRIPFNERQRYKKPVMIFHGIEFWALLVLLSFASEVFIMIFWGIMVHMLADFACLFLKNEPFYQKFSQIWLCIENRHKREFY